MLAFDHSQCLGQTLVGRSTKLSEHDGWRVGWCEVRAV
jgi:hypothetical protein